HQHEIPVPRRFRVAERVRALPDPARLFLQLLLEPELVQIFPLEQAEPPEPFPTEQEVERKTENRHEKKNEQPGPRRFGFPALAENDDPGKKDVRHEDESEQNADDVHRRHSLMVGSPSVRLPRIFRRTKTAASKTAKTMVKMTISASSDKSPSPISETASWNSRLPAAVASR